MTRNIILLVTIAALTMLVAGCFSSGSDQAPTSANTKPVANAGNDQVISQNISIQLDGTKSTDDDNGSLEYSWQIESHPNNSNASLTNLNSASPTLLVDIIGNYKINLVVYDGKESSEQDSVLIQVVEGSVVGFAGLSSTVGGLVLVENNDEEIDGISIDIPASALNTDDLFGVSVIKEMPEESPLGQQPVGKLFSLSPSGFNFNEDVTLTLPIPPGESADNLYIGTWDNTSKQWVPLATQIDSDFASADLRHLSLYGLFYAGKSTVHVINNQLLDNTDSAITLTYIAGPVPPDNTFSAETFRSQRPLPSGSTQLKQGEAAVLELLPGRYHFVISYPQPQPGVANSLWFTIPSLTTGEDDGITDQTITINDDGAISNDIVTNFSIDFPGRTVVTPTNFRPVADCSVIVPDGIFTQAVAPQTLGFTPPPTASNYEQNTTQIWRVGPVKLEEFQSAGSGISFNAELIDPEASNLLYFWTWTGSGTTLSRSGSATSGGTVRQKWANPGDFRPTRGGEYNVYLTAYDNFRLFNQCRWIVEIEPNTLPFHNVVVDDRVIDFGRLDGGPNQVDRIVQGVGPAVNSLFPGNLNPLNGEIHPVPLIVAPTITNNLCGYANNPGANNTLNDPFNNVAQRPVTSFLRTLPVLPTPGHFNPTQYPKGMTCIYALDADTDLDVNLLNLDVLDSRFLIPLPLHGRGTLYTALPIPDVTNALAFQITMLDGRTVDQFNGGMGYPAGASIHNQGIADAYRATVSYYAALGWLPSQPHQRTGPAALPATTLAQVLQRVNELFPQVAPVEAVAQGAVPDEFPYVVGFTLGSDQTGRGFKPGDLVTEDPNSLTLTPRGEVIEVQLKKGSWQNGDAEGYLVLMHVRDDFWDLRHGTGSTVPSLYVGNTALASVAYIGQSLPVIWEAPDDPDASLVTHDRRHIDPDTIPRGGTVNVEARTTDNFSRERRDFGEVAFPTPLPAATAQVAFIVQNRTALSTTLRVLNLTTGETRDVLVLGASDYPFDLIDVSQTGTILIERNQRLEPYTQWGVGSTIDLISACNLDENYQDFDDSESDISDNGNIYFRAQRLTEVDVYDPFRDTVRTEQRMLPFIFQYNSNSCDVVPIDFNNDGSFDGKDSFDVFDLVVSHQGNKLLFVDRPQSTYRLWSVSTDGFGLTLLASGENDFAPIELSGDGSTALFTLPEDLTFGISETGRISTSGGNITNLSIATNLFFASSTLDIDAKGETIVAWAQERIMPTQQQPLGGSIGLALIKADGSSWQWVDTDGVYIIASGSAPQFMPDEKSVIFSGSTNEADQRETDVQKIDNFDLYSINLDGSDLRNWTNTVSGIFEGRPRVR